MSKERDLEAINAQLRQRIEQLEADLNRRASPPDSAPNSQQMSPHEVDAVLGALPLLLFIIGPDDRYVSYRVGTGMTLFVPPETFLGRPVEAFLPSPAAVGIQRAIHRARLNGTRETVEYSLPMGGAQEQYFSAQLLPLDGGRIAALVSDTTAQHRAAEALRESEQRFRIMADGSPVILWVTGPQGRNLFVNRTYREYFGVSSAAVEGGWQPFFHPEDGLRATERFAQAVREQRPFDGEARVRRKDGEWRWVSTHGEPRYSAAGEFLGHVGITLDVSDRKHAEESLQESEERLRIVVQGSGEGIILRRADGVVSVFNPAAERLIGQTAGQMEGLTPNSTGWYMIREDGTPLPAAERPNRLALATGEPASRIIGIHKSDDTVTWLSVNSQPVFREGQPGPYAVVATLTDVTAQRKHDAVQRQLEQQLQLSQKLESVGRLAGGVAHDFNNLLAVILSCTETLRERFPGHLSVESELVDEIGTAGKRAAELTHQLLAFARKQMNAPIPIDLNAMVRRGEKLLRRVLGEDIDIVVELAPRVWTVRCDPGQMEQVILNLAINARDAMPTGGTLTIETADVEIDERLVAAHPFFRTGPHVRLLVSDSGTGMTPEVKAHLFEPFFTTKPQGKGTGLGLAVVYGIVKQHEGYILVESEPGRGTTFALYFPRVAEEAVATPVPSVAACRGSETVLLVEDDPQVRKATLRSLQSGGYRVVVASSGRDALELAAQEEGPLHLLVTDVIMPGLTGRAVADELRRLRPELRVLFVSGYAGDVISQAGVVEAGLELLEKPFTTATLLARVRAVLDAPTRGPSIPGRMS